MLRTKTGKFVAALVVSLAVLLPLVYFARQPLDIFEDDYRLFRSVKVGATEQEVVKLLGEPDKVYVAGEAPSDYYVKGYARKERPITNKVFIYIRKEPILYVYFDRQNRVEDVFVGGS